MKVNKPLLYFIIAVCWQLNFAQDKNHTAPKVELTVTACENNAFALSGLTGLDPRDENNLIIISHAGTKEKSKYGARRLHNAKLFFSSRLNIDPDLLITGEGFQIAGRGYLDFFLQGVLALRLYFPADRDLPFMRRLNSRRRRAFSDKQG